MNMKTVNYRILGTCITGSGKTVKECREKILSCYGATKFEWYSSDGAKSGIAVAK